ncbi:alpha/beta fold hydrolase [Rhodococcus erythropolis]|uniref:alpha/beta fold hydrolase n=1 Tax=Rhodococcus baikonurensis TaxID=172041 RepID=UPI00339891ED
MTSRERAEVRSRYRCGYYGRRRTAGARQYRVRYFTRGKTTSELDRADRHFEGYAAWMTRFLDAAGVTGPVTVVGHSFGGGVATALARDFPVRFARLVLVNSVGGVLFDHADCAVTRRPAIVCGVATSPVRSGSGNALTKRCLAGFGGRSVLSQSCNSGALER